MTRDQTIAHLVLHGWQPYQIRSEETPSMLRPHTQGFLEVFPVEHARGTAASATVWASLESARSYYPDRTEVSWENIKSNHLHAMFEFAETLSDT